MIKLCCFQKVHEITKNFDTKRCSDEKYFLSSRRFQASDCLVSFSAGVHTAMPMFFSAGVHSTCLSRCRPFGTMVCPETLTGISLRDGELTISQNPKFGKITREFAKFLQI